MNKKIILLGAGGHAKVLLEILHACGTKVDGILDRTCDKVGGELLGVPLVGTDGDLARFSPENTVLVNGLGSVDVPDQRAQLYVENSSKGYAFLKVLHPKAIVSPLASLGEGVQVLAGANIGPGVKIGRNAIVNSLANVDHDCEIGEHCHLAPGVVCSGAVKVGACSHIGTGAVLVQGVSLGERVMVAAGATVVGDINSGARVRGTPAEEYATEKWC